MFDRQRSSKTQVQRNLASKAREELEADAAGKEVGVWFDGSQCNDDELCDTGLLQADLAELRSTMSKEKAEIDKLM